MASTNDIPSPIHQAPLSAKPEVGDPTQDLVRQLSEVRDAKRRQKLCEEIILTTLPVADRLAARYRDRGIPIDDLRQVARAALVQAMRRFRGAGRESFLAYAIPCIRGELRRHFRDAGWVVRPPRRIQEARPVVTQARAELQHDLGHDPTLSEIATATGLPIETVREASGAGHCFQPDSLDQPIGDVATDTTVGDTMGGSDPGFRQAEARAMIRPLLDGLSPRDRQLMMLRFFDGLTQREAGERIGVSQMQVSRVEARILRTFRETLAA
jgi:RNA polymerase sigma-B factor